MRKEPRCCLETAAPRQTDFLFAKGKLFYYFRIKLFYNYILQIIILFIIIILQIILQKLKPLIIPNTSDLMLFY